MLAARIGGDHTWYSRGQKAGVAPRPCAPGRRPRQRPGIAASMSNSASKPFGRFDELGEDKELAWSCGKAVQSACRFRWGPSPGTASHPGITGGSTGSGTRRHCVLREPVRLHWERGRQGRLSRRARPQPRRHRAGGRGWDRLVSLSDVLSSRILETFAREIVQRSSGRAECLLGVSREEVSVAPCVEKPLSIHRCSCSRIASVTGHRSKTGRRRPARSSASNSDAAAQRRGRAAFGGGAVEGSSGQACLG
jgi:hypothetical protein